MKNETTNKEYTNRELNLLEIRGILRTLADFKGQSISKPKRLYELINFIKEDIK